MDVSHDRDEGGRAHRAEPSFGHSARPSVKAPSIGKAIIDDIVADVERLRRGQSDGEDGIAKARLGGRRDRTGCSFAAVAGLHDRRRRHHQEASSRSWIAPGNCTTNYSRLAETFTGIAEGVFDLQSTHCN